MLIFLLCAAAAAAVFWLVLCFVISRIAYASPKKGQDELMRLPEGEQYRPYKEQMRSMILSFDALPFEWVQIRSFDGLTLSARYYPGLPGKPAALCFHGYRSVAVRDFCGGARFLIEAGCPVILVDERAHGKSGGHAITFGIRERFDVQAWAEYTSGRFGPDTPLALFGLSMGAAAVLMASDLPLPESVKVIAADCPYSSPEEIITRVGIHRGIPRFLASPAVRTAAKLFFGFDLRESSAASSVSRTKLPIVLIHGEEDRFVPCEMSRHLQAANPQCVELHTFPGAAHGISFLTDPERYRRLMAHVLALCGEDAGEKGGNPDALSAN